MKDFIYKQPTNVKDAARLFKENPGALPYSGGTDLLGLIKDDIIHPDVLIDLKRLPGMDKISYTPGKGLHIGALVKIADIAAHKTVKEKFPVLALAARAVASPQLRNIGTIGGNICQRPRCWYFRGDFNCIRKGGDTCFAVEGENKFHCIIGGGPCFIVHPSDTAVALLASNASINIFNGKKTVTMTLKDFFVLPDKEATKENVLEAGQFITEIMVPDSAADPKGKFLKYTERDVWDSATVSGAMVSGTIVLGGVAPIPWIVKDKDNPLKDAEPMEHNAYKVTLAKNLIKELLKG